MIFRVPEEPNTIKYPEQKGVILPDPLDFTKLPTASRQSNMDDAVQKHIKECIHIGLELTDPENEQFDLVTTKDVIMTGGRQNKIRVESISIAGSAHPDIMGIRHIARLEGVSPDYLLDAYNRLNYTDIIDKFTYLVEQIEDIDVPQQIKKEEHEDTISWCHVVLTADRLVPFFLSIRDFVTFDFVSQHHRMLVSRSCIHPSQPQTSPPCCGFVNNKNTYRVPLQYFLRILPCPEDTNSCTVVQFQYSDVGGIIPPTNQTQAIIDFGLENISKFCTTVSEAKQKGLALGPGTEGYLKNPLKPKWRQLPKDMIPGL